MLVEYVACKYSRLRWKPTPNGYSGDKVVVGGTWDNDQHNKLVVWVVEGSDESYELKVQQEKAIAGDVTRINDFGGKFMAVTTTAGSVLVYALPENELELVGGHANLHNGSCSDVGSVEIEELVTSGEDGKLNFINTDDSVVKQSIQVSETALECLDVLSSHQIICGNQVGHLKVIDSRKKSGSALSLASNDVSGISAVLCVKRNPSNAHIVASGNDEGRLCLWDLRKTSSLLIQLEAHQSFITDMYYEEKDAHSLLTSSDDGQLLQWNIQPNMEFENCNPVLGDAGASPISCFHLNSDREIVCGADNETITIGRLA